MANGESEACWFVCLLHAVRKVLTLGVAARDRDVPDECTGPRHSGFKQARGCAHTVWAERVLVSADVPKRFGLHKMGAGMTRAFRTV